MRQGRPITAEEWEKFLRRFARTGNMTLAAKGTPIGRSTVYSKLESDEDFRQRYEDAEKAAFDLLEAEARRRAEKGIARPVVSAGKIIAYQRHYSDALMALLLRAHGPAKYRDRVEVGGIGGGPVQVQSARERIAARIASIAARRRLGGGTGGGDAGGAGGA